MSKLLTPFSVGYQPRYSNGRSILYKGDKIKYLALDFQFGNTFCDVLTVINLINFVKTKALKIIMGVIKAKKKNNFLM